MPEDQPRESSISGALPDIENLADSDDPKLIAARAKLLEAQANLAKASRPLFDKIVLRGIIPIALLIVGPWALWKFDDAQTEQKKQGEVIVKLEKLLSDAKDETKARQARSIKWRVRMGELEEERAAELAAMSFMVNRLDNTMKMALVHMTVAQLLSSEEERGRKEVMSDVAAQIRLPEGTEEVKRLAGQAYDRMMRQRKAK
ncbi:hypothetical protein LCGC14_2403680 [marine sediment metagenome]|uniref:Uncharacterized protein n=1 Tax=marine sediment metagenome TaxID=412755 RepID=A0A0F9BUR5_9ZZZZ